MNLNIRRTKSTITSLRRLNDKLNLMNFWVENQVIEENKRANEEILYVYRLQYTMLHLVRF